MQSSPDKYVCTVTAASKFCNLTWSVVIEMEVFERALESATSKEGRAQRVAHGIIIAAVDKSGKLHYFVAKNFH
jgi:hypothetical protein